MGEPSIRDLRDQGREAVGLPRDPVPLAVLRAHRVHLPPVDPDALRRDLDTLVDPAI